MIKAPCEHLQYDLLPNIRKELANCLIEIFKLNQRQAAKKLGLTPAAICQYKNHKRADNSEFSQEIMMEIVRSANRINNEGDLVVQTELCRLCLIARDNGYINKKRG
jgi:predicted transcriptional regulator